MDNVDELKEKYKKSPYNKKVLTQTEMDGHHEVLDRVSIIISNINDFVLNHDVIQSDKDLKNNVEIATTILNDVYQNVGRKLKLPEDV